MVATIEGNFSPPRIYSKPSDASIGASMRNRPQEELPSAYQRDGMRSMCSNTVKHMLHKIVLDRSEGNVKTRNVSNA